MQLENQNDTVAFLSRLFMSSLFILYGYFKLTGYAGTVAYMTKLGLPSFFAALAVIIELGGGILILLGYQTRLVSYGLAIYVIIASFIAHRHFADPGQLSNFMKNMAIVGGFLAMAASGGGALSLDGRKQ
ncbi:MAG TPA: DoxX family protein [Pseudolabrys sp.]|jgi:putative oxidoreductase|nr:DoxX family protein [Pseudolabrys sp.]